MCLGIPGKVLEIEAAALTMGKVAFGGIVKSVCLAYVPTVSVGDYVIVHAGFAINRLDEAEAARVFAHLAELGDLAELGPTPNHPANANEAQ